MKNSWSSAKRIVFAALCSVILSASLCRRNPPSAGAAPAPVPDSVSKPAPVPGADRSLPAPEQTPAPQRGTGSARPNPAHPQPPPGATPPNNTTEVKQGRSPDQARIDSLKRAGGKKDGSL